MTVTKQQIIFLLSTLYSGLSTAFIFPLVSLYLIDEIGVPPIKLGIFLAAMVISGVYASLLIGKKSDQGANRKQIVVVAQVCFFIAVSIMAFTRDFYISLVAAIFFLSVSSSSLPQLFTMGRIYADKHLADRSVIFLSMMRAAIAVAWVIGPPVAFLLKDSLGFTLTFMVSGGFALTLLVLVLFLPVEPEIKDNELKPDGQAWFKVSGVALFLFSILAMYTANNMYITSIPLYITKELLLGSQWAGYLMGTAALIEIPIMLLAGLLAPKFGSKRLLVIGVISGIAFYVGLLMADNIWQLFALQVFNGLFIGITGSLGIIFIQNLMSKQMGLATTLFNNAMQLSMLLGGLAIGVVAQYFSYYAIFIGSLICSLIALCFILLVNSTNRSKLLNPLQADKPLAAKVGSETANI